jgi:hypothetical protein
MIDKDGTAQIRALNDQLRTTRTGGRVMMTNGIQALGQETVPTILRAIAAFDAFTPDNDPHQEHDCATLDVEGTKVLWKIDYYDVGLNQHSPDPSDPSVTARVMTVMLAEEY